MTDESQLAFTPAWKQAEMVAARQVSPAELVDVYLRRIERIDPHIGAYITVAVEQARDAALEAEITLSRPSARSQKLPPLFGVPVSLKDVEATRGIPTTLGSRVFADTVPAHDSVVAERVRAAGAIIIGKTNTPEIAIHLQTITDNEVHGPARNPWDMARTTGGSSGGAAAAQVTGLCAVAVGSDGGGSIRIPAAFCGVFGMKPSQGRVPRAGGLGRPDPNQFAQSGPMSNNVMDAAVLLHALSGPDPRDPQPYLREQPPDFGAAVMAVSQDASSRPLEGLRAGWSVDLGHAPVDPEVARVCEAAARKFEALGAHVDDAPLQFSTDLPDHFWVVFGANAYVQYGHLLEESRHLLGESARTALERGKQVMGHQYARSLREVNALRFYVDSVFEKYDLLLTPTTAVPAFNPSNRPMKIAGRDVHSITGFYPFTFPFNMTGHPAATVPCGFVQAGPGAGQAGLPVGLQVIGKRRDDAGVLMACAAFEKAHPWSGTRPPVALTA
jgi:Asp-tRNA(Asn)/Glu-tRNA(Gln) amidotransferase A subunit family amidase